MGQDSEDASAHILGDAVNIVDQLGHIVLADVGQRFIWFIIRQQTGQATACRWRAALSGGYALVYTAAWVAILSLNQRRKEMSP